jgi:hypothetical protein
LTRLRALLGGLMPGGASSVAGDCASMHSGHAH